MCTSIELYQPAESVLRSIHRDKSSLRVHDVKPGEESIWDGLSTATFHVYGVDSKTGRVHDKEVRSHFYTEADTLEDAVLFPEDCQGKRKGPIPRIAPYSELHELENGIYPWEKFINDMDTDEELSDEDAEELLHRRSRRPAIKEGDSDKDQESDEDDEGPDWDDREGDYVLNEELESDDEVFEEEVDNEEEEDPAQRAERRLAIRNALSRTQ